MDKRKYRILKTVHMSVPTVPVKRTDFYTKRRTLIRNKCSIDDLIRVGYITEAHGSYALRITDKGIEALESESGKLRDRRRQAIRYWITTAISLLALALSIIALLAELGILRLQ